MVDVAQLVRASVVVPRVAGSNPVFHPYFFCIWDGLTNLVSIGPILFPLKI